MTAGEDSVSFTDYQHTSADRVYGIATGIAALNHGFLILMT